MIRFALAPVQTKGGIYVPDAARGSKHEGFVLHVGSRVEDPEIVAGKRVFFQSEARYTGQTIRIGDNQVKVVHEDDLLMTVLDGDVHACPHCNGVGILQGEDSATEESDNGRTAALEAGTGVAGDQ